MLLIQHAFAKEAPEIHVRRLEELAYLANVLVAGGGVGRTAAGWEGRAVRPHEAMEIVVSTIELGMKKAAARQPGKKLILGEVPLDKLFLAGMAGRSGGD